MSTRENAIVEYLDYQIPVKAIPKARLKCATYRWYTELSVMGVRVGVANFWTNRCIDETNTFQLKFFIQQYISVKIFYLA